MKIDEKEHALEVLRQMDNFRKTNRHCDFTIKVGSKSFPVHRNVLSASSDYFKAMLSYDTKENQCSEVKIKDCDPECIKKCVDFMYSGSATVANEKREPMMHVAHLMQLRRLCDGIALSLEESLDSESFFATKRVANIYSCRNLEKKCEEFALENFRSISLEDGFKCMEEDYLELLIKSKETKASESAKCKSLIVWASIDLDKRSKFFEEMLGHINLLKIPLGYRRYLIEKEPLVFLSNPCLKALLISIMDKANVLAKDFAMKDDGIKNAIAAFDKPSKAIQVFEPEQRRWTRMQNIPDEINGKQFTTVLMGDHLYVLMNDRTGYRLNYSDVTATWLRIPDRTQCARVVAAVLDGSIYVFDNTNQNSNAVERLNLDDGTWSHVTDREHRSYEIAVTASQGIVYFAGGFNGSSQYYATFSSFDPIAKSWTDLPNMPTARYGASALEISGKVYIMGGRTGSYLNTVESFDVDKETWTTVSNMNHTRYLFSSGVLGEKIFVIGGTNSGNTVELMDPYENTWSVVETMTGKDIHPESSTAVHLFT